MFVEGAGGAPGGGVAGSVSAVALRRIGADVTVLESHADPGGAVGSFVSLATNGLRALDAVGARQTVVRHGAEVERQRLWSSTGKLLADTPRGRRRDEPLRSVTLMRADLVAGLRELAMEAGAKLVAGAEVLSVDRRGDSDAQVALSDGRRLDADLVIGADGIWSVTRESLNPSGPRPQYAGMYTVSGVTKDASVEPGVFNMVYARAWCLRIYPDRWG